MSSRRPLATPEKIEATTFTLGSDWIVSKDGNATVVDIVPGIVAVGTDKGMVHIFTYGGGRQILRPYLTIPPPPASGMSVSTVKLAVGKDKASVFVGYRRSASPSSARGTTAGVSCYDMPLPGPNLTPITAPSARHDLDGRQVASSNLCDAVSTVDGVLFTVVRKSLASIRIACLDHNNSELIWPSFYCKGSNRWSLHILDNTKSGRLTN
jgi:hypothetical protein